MKRLRRWLVISGGGLVIVLGVFFMPLPGPGAPIVVAGLAILSSEVPWARRLLKRLKDYLKKIDPKNRWRRVGLAGIVLGLVWWVVGAVIAWRVVFD